MSRPVQPASFAFGGFAAFFSMTFLRREGGFTKTIDYALEIAYCSFVQPVMDVVSASGIDNYAAMLKKPQMLGHCALSDT